MRAITVRQPWAWAIIHGGKDVENRTRNIAGSYRGPLAIHAGLQVDEGGMWAEPIQDAFARLDSSWELEQHLLNLGVIVGVVDLVDVHLETSTCCTSRWAERVSRYDENPINHLVLRNPRPVTPIPARGMLGLWTPWVEDQLRVDASLWADEIRSGGDS